MDYRIFWMICLQLTKIYSTPLQNLQMQLFPPHQMNIPMPMGEPTALEQQLMALQHLQAIQNFETIHAPSTLYLPQPIVYYLPDHQNDKPDKEKLKTNALDNTNNPKHNNEGYIDEILDSVVIEPEDILIENKQKFSRKAVIVLPDGRLLGIGEFISSIPWLPFEVNVPDTVSWAYNGISSGISAIIAGIGQRWPFRPRPQLDPMMIPKEPSFKNVWNRLQMNNRQAVPIMIVPIDGVVGPNDIMPAMLSRIGKSMETGEDTTTEETNSTNSNE